MYLLTHHTGQRKQSFDLKKKSLLYPIFSIRMMAMEKVRTWQHTSLHYPLWTQLMNLYKLVCFLLFSFSQRLEVRIHRSLYEAGPCTTEGELLLCCWHSLHPSPGWDKIHLHRSKNVQHRVSAHWQRKANHSVRNKDYTHQWSASLSKQ